MNNLLERFLQYVALDTQSRAGTRQTPSTEGQWALLHLLKSQLEQLALADIRLSEHGTLMARLPANTSHAIPAIGFIAHVDTSPDFSGKQVQPQIVENYRGGDIALGTGEEVLSPVRFPVLHQLSGKTLITTNGKTLLGADDKAGITAIISALEQLKQQQQPHGDICVAFTPDEEIGDGARYFDVAAFGAAWAYTVDGGATGELEFENFNAASATVKITGNNVHAGSAKDVLVNALALAVQFHQVLPPQETPECTEGYAGFYHLYSMKGNAERAEMHYLIRDFTDQGFACRKQTLLDIASAIRQALPYGCHIEVIIKDSYYNMREKIAAHPHIIDLARQAMQDCGIEPIIRPIRGGTDGAQLSFKGLPCPNLFTGGYNFHSKYEFVTLEGMAQAAAVVQRIALLTAQRALQQHDRQHSRPHEQNGQSAQ